MEQNDGNSKGMEEVMSKVFRAGRRTYFFDVKETKAGDYYLTITESKKTTFDDGSANYKKHKIYLYKEDFANFQEALTETVDFIRKEKGDAIISGKSNDSSSVSRDNSSSDNSSGDSSTTSFDDIKFEDI